MALFYTAQLTIDLINYKLQINSNRHRKQIERPFSIFGMYEYSNVIISYSTRITPEQKSNINQQCRPIQFSINKRADFVWDPRVIVIHFFFDMIVDLFIQHCCKELKVVKLICI